MSNKLPQWPGVKALLREIIHHENKSLVVRGMRGKQGNFSYIDQHDDNSELSLKLLKDIHD